MIHVDPSFIMDFKAKSPVFFAFLGLPAKPEAMVKSKALIMKRHNWPHDLSLFLTSDLTGERLKR